MPFMPKLTETSQTTDVTDTFYGYNHSLKCADGEWYDTHNLTSSYYPLLSPRGKRTHVLTMARQQGLIEKDALGYVNNGTFYYNFQPTGLTGLTAGEKQLVSMGAYVCVFPDKKYYNTQDSTDYGSMEAHYTSSGKVKYTMCHADGTPYTDVSTEDTEPESKTAIWVTHEDGTSVALYYSQTEKSWVKLNTVYTRLTFNSKGVIPAQFKDLDAVEISGSSYDGINGSKVIQAIGGSSTEKDWIVVIHQLDGKEFEKTETVKLDRNVPDCDFVIEAQNRLWGCYYGLSDDGSSTLNEIRCSALGDFRNWNQFQGLSTDSWVGSQGTDGVWTGAVNYLGSPTFFKENHIHVVGISSVGAHQITETPARGVQRGSDKSLVIVNETLYYKSRNDICAYRGSFPEGVSEALGEEKYYSAVAGSYGEKLYISMKDGQNRYSLFTYDINKGIWLKEDDLNVRCFSKVDDSLYAVTNDHKLLDLNGKAVSVLTQYEGLVDWSCESGIIYYRYKDKNTAAYYRYPSRKHISRFNIRLKGERDAWVKLFIQYDSEGPWEYKGTVRQQGTGTIVVPIIPRRCDHMRIKLEGHGDMKIYSIARMVEGGSDV